jgi:hypothetical protein
MSEEPNNKKCSFGAFLDIIDDLQKTYRKPVSGKKDEKVRDKKCRYCDKTIGLEVKICPHCRNVKSR